MELKEGETLEEFKERSGLDDEEYARWRELTKDGTTHLGEPNA